MYKSGYKYQLHADYRIKLPINFYTEYVTDYIEINSDSILTIKKGYCWDGASGPTIDTKNTMRASLVHDALYQLIRQRVLSKCHRNMADDLFYDILREDGMSYIRAKIWHNAVKNLGASAASPKAVKTIITAP
jgi:hypothetical protein